MLLTMSMLCVRKPTEVRSAPEEDSFQGKSHVRHMRSISQASFACVCPHACCVVRCVTSTYCTSCAWLLQCEASSASTVRIVTQHEVAFGEVVKVVGTQEQLGAWDPAAAPGAHTSPACACQVLSSGRYARICTIVW